MAGSAGVKTGINSGAYRNAGTYGTPTWTEATSVRDVTPSFAWDMVDASARATKAKLYAKTQVDLGAQLVVRADDLAADYQALFDAAVSQTAVVDYLILDGDITAEACRGMRAEFVVSISGQTQGAGDVIYTTFDLKPTYTTNGVPKWVTMGAASAPSFTAA